MVSSPPHPPHPPRPPQPLQQNPILLMSPRHSPLICRSKMAEAQLAASASGARAPMVGVTMNLSLLYFQAVTVGMPFLKLGVGARPVAMGEAF